MLMIPGLREQQEQVLPLHPRGREPERPPLFLEFCCIAFGSNQRRQPETERSLGESF